MIPGSLFPNAERVRAVRDGIIAIAPAAGVPLTEAQAVAIADLQDTYELCSDGRWRIKVRDIKEIFESDALKAQIAAAKQPK